MTDNKERDAFETWLKERPYANFADYAWAAWQARAALAASQEKAEPVAYVDGDDSLRRILWEPDQAAFNLPVGTKLYAAPVAAQEKVEPFAWYSAKVDDVITDAKKTSRAKVQPWDADHYDQPLYTEPQPSAEAVRDAALLEGIAERAGEKLTEQERGHIMDVARNIRALKSAPTQPAEQPSASPAAPVAQGLTDEQIVDAVNRADAADRIRLITSDGKPTWVARHLVHEILARATPGAQKFALPEWKDEPPDWCTPREEEIWEMGYDCAMSSCISVKKSAQGGQS